MHAAPPTASLRAGDLKYLTASGAIETLTPAQIAAMGTGNEVPAAALAPGSPIDRNFQINDYQFYGQDQWHVTPNLVLTYGLNYTLEQPPYEANGLAWAEPRFMQLDVGVSKAPRTPWRRRAA